MITKFKKVIALLGFIVTWGVLVCLIKDNKLKSVVYDDLAANSYKCPYTKPRSLHFLNYMLLYDTIFQTQYTYRLKYYHHDISFILAKLLFRKAKDMDLWGDIDGGMCIYHGQGVVFVCQKAGKNLSIYQGVTVGRGPQNAVGEFNTPTFGDNVSVFANAVVIGNVKIGNNVKIAAGSVCYKDVPDNCTVVGNPMKIIQH